MKTNLSVEQFLETLQSRQMQKTASEVFSEKLAELNKVAQETEAEVAPEVEAEVAPEVEAEVAPEVEAEAEVEAEVEGEEKTAELEKLAEDYYQRGQIFAMGVFDKMSELEKLAEDYSVDTEEVEILSKYAEYADSLLQQEYGKEYTEEDVVSLASQLIDRDVNIISEQEMPEKTASAEGASHIMRQLINKYIGE